MESGLAVQIIMVILVFFSIWSWAIFFKKIRDLSQVKKSNQVFLKSFRFQKDLDKIHNFGHLLNNNIYGRVLKSGFEEFKFLKTNSNFKLFDLADNIKLAMERTKISEIENLENSLPILGTMAIASGSHPFLIMIPATIACSCAFMLPSGTGPNTVIFGSGRVTIPQMARCGFGLNIIGIIVVTIIIYIIGIPLLGMMDGLPDWAR